MKRDMDLIREILLDLEKQENRHTFRTIEAKGKFSKEEVFHHYCILKEAGFINGKPYAEIPFAATLTWEGHNFLDDARNDTVWKKTKDFIKEKGDTASFQVVVELLKKFTLKHFEIG